MTMNLTVTEAARNKVKELIEAENEPGLGIRFGIRGRSGGAFQYDLHFEPDSNRKADDQVIETGGLKFYIDARSASDLDGVTLDFVDDVQGSGFKIDNPNPIWRDPVSIAVQNVIDSQINPSVGMHGGFVTLLDVKNGTAYVALGGGCHGCGMADVTLKQGIVVAIKGAVPEIREVIDSTDHAGGTNPYYQGQAHKHP